jgi:hypothetical protein
MAHASHRQVIAKHCMSSVICLMLLQCYYNKATCLNVILKLCSVLKNLVVQNKLITK